MAESLVDMLRRWTAIPGISGHENAVARAFTEECTALGAAEVRIDALANAVARFEPAQPAGHSSKIALCAHLDTVGLMVKTHHADGTLGVMRVGGVNLRALPGTPVTVHTRVGARSALIGVRSQHQARPGDMQLSVEALFIEGIPVHEHVHCPPGTPITYAAAPVQMGALFASSGLDDRAGVVALLDIARRLGTSELATRHTVYVIGTAQEETTCLGAYAALAAVQPDAAIFIDGTVTYDTPDTRGGGGVGLGGGPVLLSMLYVSGLNGWHAHPGLLAQIERCASESGIPVQHDAVQGLMSDARAAALLGIPSAIIGIPMRGKHAPLETMQLSDFAAVIELAALMTTRALPDLARG